MFPRDIHLLGLDIAIWEVMFVVAVATAYPLFLRVVRDEPRFNSPSIRFLAIVYLSALSAQLFAYLFDATGSLLPPPGTSLASWYLTPLGGPKTLYGVIVLMPVSVTIATIGTRIPLRRVLDLCTPVMFLVLAIARVGCFLQGCCFGAPSESIGIQFPTGSPVYFHQLAIGMIAEGSAPIPVVPTQAIEAVFLFGIAGWTVRRWARNQRSKQFVPAIAAYSIFRFGIEFVRADVDRGLYGPLATSQWIALGVLFAAGAYAVLVGTRSPRLEVRTAVD